MSGLFWPGDHRAGAVFGDAALLTAMTTVEQAWLDTLDASGIAPAADLTDLVTGTDAAHLALAAEAGGNPVIAFVALLRERAAGRDAAAAGWIHRGLTSQDVLDTALVLLARDGVAAVRADLDQQIDLLAAMAGRHRATPMVGRTLTQPAVPISFGVKVASWRNGVVDAAEDLAVLRFPAQFGGAAGNLSGLHAVAAGRTTAAELVAGATGRLGLDTRPPWHTARAPMTRIGDALTRAHDAWGHIAGDVLTLTRPEIGELAEGSASGRGGSSTMPQKANPVLSLLIRRAALVAPALGGLLHTAAADVRDERPDGAWHVEWQTLQQLVRHAVTAASQTTELLAGLQVDARRMQENLEAARPGVDAESAALAELVGRTAEGSADDVVIDAALARTRRDATT